MTTQWPLQVPCWHQWQFNHNSINNLPLCHWWQQLMLPLRSCSPFHQASLPLWHQWQRVPICQFSCEFTVFWSIYHILLVPPVIVLCFLPLSLRAKGIPPDVFHILFMIFMWTSIMFSIHFLKYLHQLSHYPNWLSSPSSTSLFIIPQLNSSFLIYLFFAFAYDLFWCAPLSSMLPLSLCFTSIVMFCSYGPVKYLF